MKKIDYCTYILSDGTICNVYPTETVLWTSQGPSSKWLKKAAKIELKMPREQALQVLTLIDESLLKEDAPTPCEHYFVRPPFSTDGAMCTKCDYETMADGGLLVH